MIAFGLDKKDKGLITVLASGVVIATIVREGDGPKFIPKEPRIRIGAMDMVRILRQMGVSVKADFGTEEKAEKAVAEQTAVLTEARAVRFGKAKANPGKINPAKPAKRKAKK